MILALRVAIDKPQSRREAKACADLVQSLDKLMVQHEIEPVTWVADEEDERLIFEAYIPADCLPELDDVAEVLDECASEFNSRQD